MDDNSPSRLVGRIIADRYRVKRVVAEGGMGVVYEAEQTLGEGVRSVAIKTLLPELSRDHLVVSRFSRECAVVASLEHPNIVRVYDFGKTDDGILYIAMEFVRGRPLGDVMAEGALPVPRSLAILEQMCSALSEAHDLGIVHRDLKPDNVVLSERAGIHDFVKLLDFGIAKRSSSGGKLDTKLTQQGMVLGTPPYMSPEQFTAEVPDRTSDIYALAVILYEMLNGRLPFDADTPWQWAHHHMSSEPAPFEPSVPVALQRVILRAMSKQRPLRPATTLEFYRELAAASGLATDRPRSSVPPASRVPREVPRTEPSMVLGDLHASLPPAAPRPYATSPHTLSDAPKAIVTEPGNDGGVGQPRTGTAMDVAPLPYGANTPNHSFAPPSGLPQATASRSPLPSTTPPGDKTEPSAFGLRPSATIRPYADVAVVPPRGSRPSPRRKGLRVLAWFSALLVVTGAAVAGSIYWYHEDDGTPPLPSAVPLLTEQPPVEIAGERRTTDPAWPRVAEISPAAPERGTPSRGNPGGVPTRRDETVAQGGTGATPTSGTSTAPSGTASGGAAPTGTLPFPFPIQIPTGIIPNPFPPQNPSTPSTTPTTPQTPTANPASCTQAMATAASNLDVAIDHYQTCNNTVGGASASAARLTIVNAGRARVRSLARQGRCQEASAVVTTLARINAQNVAQRDLQQSGCAGQ